MVDNPEVTQVIELHPGIYRVRGGTEYWREISAGEAELHRLVAVPLDVELPWAECEACKRRFLDWDNDGLCPECEAAGREPEFDICDVPGVPHMRREFGSIAELDADSAGYPAL